MPDDDYRVAHCVAGVARTFAHPSLLLPRLLTSGVLCRVDYLFVEWHLNALPAAQRLQGVALRHALDATLRGCPIPRATAVVHDENPYNNFGEPAPGLAEVAARHRDDFAPRLPTGRRWMDADFEEQQQEQRLAVAPSDARDALSRRWFNRSLPGYCAATDYGEGDCERGDKGGVQLEE